MSMSAFHAIVLAVTTTSLMAGSPHAHGAEQGTAVARAVTLPPASSGSVRFTGTPAGQRPLDASGTATLVAEVASGRHVSTLARISPELLSQGYVLTAITCDDPASQGDLGARSATFKLQSGKTVTCIFQLALDSLDEGGTDTGQACTCPRQGHWAVANHTGSMACSGALSMTFPLAASQERGTLDTRDDCATVHASGMSEDEVDIDMHLQKDCSYLGKVGGERDGIPMIIRFRWDVENSRRITGNLKSTFSRDGMTCKMSRTYRLDYSGPGS